MLEKVNDAVCAFTVPLGASLRVVSGGVVSTVQVKLGGFGSGLPPESVATTWKVYVPSARPE